MCVVVLGVSVENGWDDVSTETRNAVKCMLPLQVGLHVGTVPLHRLRLELDLGSFAAGMLS